MLDFKQLNDPVRREQFRKEREELDARAEAHERALRRELNICLEALDYQIIEQDERSLVRNCQSRLNSYLPLSEKQEKWLLDIAQRVRKALASDIKLLIERHAAGDVQGQHRTYPRSDWPNLGRADVDPEEYWFWVLRLVRVFGEHTEK